VLTAAEAIKCLGGSASLADLLCLTSRKRIRRAELSGEVVRLSHGVYALTDTSAEQKAAATLHGVLSHQSAAAHWLMKAIASPSSIHVTVPRNARPLPRKGVTLHYADVDEEEVTSPLRTVLDCAAALPFREALAIADSACRMELITSDQLVAAALQLRGPSRRRVRQVAVHADGRADNPFESALRAIVIERGITGFEPQLLIPRGYGTGLSGSDKDKRVDLGDPDRLVVFEADSFEHHGTRQALAADCRRYDELVSQGWQLLRFAYEQVMFEADRVGDMMEETCRVAEMGAIRARRSTA
jgi:hypothetical protein